ACSGGCVGGVLTVENPYVAEVKLKRLRKYMPVARSHIEGNAEAYVHWTMGVQFEPVFRLGDNMMESFSRLERVERLCKKLPGLDCGSCGAPTCKALAEDIVRGEAGEKDCIYNLRDNLHKLSKEVSVLAENLADGEKNGEETLNILKEYIQRISEEMTLLDSKVREE
ncbi:MAG: (Fe-S)-binding protein, partial [Hungatella sp.]